MPAAVRGTSAGKLKNGGKARIAIIETAPAIPMTAVAATMVRDDVTKTIITRNAASMIGPKSRRPRAHLEAIGGEKQYRHRHSCEPLSQASAAEQFRLAKRRQIVAEKGALVPVPKLWVVSQNGTLQGTVRCGHRIEAFQLPTLSVMIRARCGRNG
jgi:hypothetical protein